jgi:hypothetical protein
MKASITPLLKYEIVNFIKADMFPVAANTYVAIGRPIRWGGDDTETSDEIENVVYTTDSVNQVFRDMMAMKKVESADTALVVPRVDWVTNTTYDEYHDHIQLFSHIDTLYVGTANATGNTVVANTAVFSGNISIGNTVSLNSETRQVIGVNTTHLIVNSVFTYDVTNGDVFRVDDKYPFFANNFYCRNSKDQVFKCLFNNINAPSTIEPTIDIDGQLPENPYILTGDGYKWKYLYTIPYGLKQKFFTNNWMPVNSDNSVIAGAVDGRIDTYNIEDGGSGYFLNNGESGNSNSLSIITVTGDGEGASITAEVQSGVIIDLNIINGGSGYTYANVTVNDSDQLATGNIAILSVEISPPGGHGSNPAKELGCYSIMTVVTFEGTEGDLIPVGGGSYPFDFRQISLLRDPLLANSDYATESVYRTTTKLGVTSTGGSNYVNDEVVYIGTSLESASMTGVVVNWNPTLNELFINNVRGTPTVGATLVGSTATAAILGVEEPDIKLFTGDVLYIENRAKIVRDVDQTEQIRLVLSF